MAVNIILLRDNNFKDKYKKMYSLSTVKYMETFMELIKENLTKLSIKEK